MMWRIFKVSFFPVLMAVVTCFTVATSSAADDKAAGLTKFEVEQVIHNYIVNNPKLILDTLTNYEMKNGPQGRANGVKSDAIVKNKDALFNDPTSPQAGNVGGDVSIVEFMDYNCHFCKDALPTIQALIEKDKNVHVVFKDLPILGPSSETAAKWALAANKQKKYFEFHSLMMKNRSPITDDLLEKVAKDVGMNVDQAKKDIDGSEVQLQLEKNRALAGNIGVNGTPAFVIGDEISPGALSLDRLTQKVADQRKKKAK